MSTRDDSNRGALAGQLAIFAVLLAAACALLPLHAGPWWPAPPPSGRVWLAVATSLAWLLGAALVLRRRGPAPVQDGSAAQAPAATVLVAWASQTGFAATLAERSADMLRSGGRPARVLPLDQVDATCLAAARQVLFVVSTTGEGDPPDHALSFLRQMQVGADGEGLAHLEYALLALGDRDYDDFCGFGRQLDQWLRVRGAQPLFDRVEVDNADEAALRHWQYEVGRIGGDATGADWSTPAYAPWRLASRELLNPGSQGGPVHALSLLPASGALPTWLPGDIAEVGPRNPPARVGQWMQALGLDAHAAVDAGAGPEPLADLLARCGLPAPDSVRGLSPQELANRLQRLPHREYSIASIPGERHLQLLVREMYAEDGSPGLGSGWLCRHAPVDGSIDLRLRSNPGFHPPAAAQPLVLIGNGTGMAGLRAHLAARVAAGAHRNWLLFGERNAACDLFFGDELRRWQDGGWLSRLDLAFSREGDRAYVQDRLQAAAPELATWVDQGAVILVCGSADTMAPGVDAALAAILGAERRDALREQGRYRRDVY